jgi:trimeric autotransporter adhesin
MSLTKVTNSLLNLTDLTTHFSNTGIGLLALAKNGTGPHDGFNNTAVGYAALTQLDGSGINTNPTGNTAFGYLAAPLSQGATNTVIGASAHRFSVDGDDNTIVGAQANYSNLSGIGNTLMGFQAGYNNLASYNDAFGNLALFSTTSGTSNVAMGGGSLYSNQTGSSNTAIGVGSLSAVTQGGNIGLGYFAGYYATGANEFYINNRNLANNATEKTDSLVYGAFNATAANQIYRINGRIVSGKNIPLNIKSSAPTIASATSISPDVAIVFVSGTAAIDAINVPSWMEGGAQITLIPLGVFTTTTSNNIALASTAVVNRVLIMTYDAVTTKWYPSY